MPTVLTTSSAPEPYDFLASFERACTSTGLDFRLVFDSYFLRGYVFKGPDYLMLGAPDPHVTNAWHVMWAEFHPFPGRMQAVARLVRLMPYPLPYVGWNRDLRGQGKTRYYLTDRVLRLTAGMPTAHAISAPQPRA